MVYRSFPLSMLRASKINLLPSRSSGLFTGKLYLLAKCSCFSLALGTCEMIFQQPQVNGGHQNARLRFLRHLRNTTGRFLGTGRPKKKNSQRLENRTAQAELPKGCCLGCWRDPPARSSSLFGGFSGKHLYFCSTFLFFGFSGKPLDFNPKVKETKDPLPNRRQVLRGPASSPWRRCLWSGKGRAWRP